MSQIQLDNEPCTLLARVRPAGPPFEEQDGSLVGLDIGTAGGKGISNLRMTKLQAMALRDCLFAYFQRGQLEMTIAVDSKGLAHIQERQGRQ